MIHSKLNIKKRIKTEPTHDYIIPSLYYSIKPNTINTNIPQPHNIHQLINYNPQINFKYSQIKIALATQSIYYLTSKLTSTKLLSYKLILFHNLSNYQTNLNKSTTQNCEFIIHKQLQQLNQDPNKFQQNTVLIQKSILINNQILIKRRISQLFHTIDKQIYLNKIIALIQLFQYIQQEQNLLKNMEYQYNKQTIQNKEIMAIKFASTTLIIKSINNKRLQYQSVFFIRLRESEKLQSQFSITNISINQSNSNKIEGFDLVENKLKAICLLNQVIKKIQKNYFLSLKLQNLSNFKQSQNLKSSIFNSQSNILKKLIRSGESIIELYQSTNDTEQSKKDQDQDDIILKRKNMMNQTYHPEPLIKQRISIIQQSQRLESAQKQLIELKTIIKSQKKSKLLWFSLINLILGAILILRIFEQVY